MGLGVFQSPFDSTISALFDTQQLASLPSVSGKLNIYQRLAAEIGPLTWSVGYAADGNAPDMAAGGNGDMAVIYIGGATNLQLAANYVLGSESISRNFPYVGFNNGTVNAAATLVSVLAPRRRAANRLRVVGHSFGGTIAMAVKRWFELNDNAGASRETVTYGSPKPGVRAASSTIGAGTIVRWMLAQDPVPLIMPSFDDQLSNRIIAPSSIMGAWSANIQPRGGVAMMGDYTLQEAIKPPTGVIQGVSNFVQWILGLDTQIAPLHSVTAYRDWFAHFQGLIMGGGMWDVPDHLSPAEPAVPISSRQLTQREAQIETQIALASEQQHLQEVQVPQAQAFVAVRYGRVWAVAFGDTLVTVEANKRHARAVARLGNMWLARVQTSAVVDPNALAIQFQSYLAAAQDPAKGFVPVMNTTLPG